MPNIYNALVVKGRDTAGQQINVTCEVQQLLGNNRVKAIAMSATDGLMRGMEVIDTKAPLSIPVGGATLGGIFNVLGEPIGNLGPIDTHTTSLVPLFLFSLSLFLFSPIICCYIYIFPLIRITNNLVLLFSFVFFPFFPLSFVILFYSSSNYQKVQSVGINRKCKIPYDTTDPIQLLIE